MSSRMTQSQCGNLMGGVGSWFELSCPYFCLGLFVPCYHNHFGLSGFNCLQTAFFLIMWLMCQSSHCDIVFQLQTFLSHGTVQSVDLPVNHCRDGTSIIAGSYSSVGFEQIHYVQIFGSYLIWFWDDLNIQYSSEFRACLVLSKVHGYVTRHLVLSDFRHVGTSMQVSDPFSVHIKYPRSMVQKKMWNSLLNHSIWGCLIWTRDGVKSWGSWVAARPEGLVKANALLAEALCHCHIHVSPCPL